MHDVVALLYLMLPAYVANMAAPFSRFWPGRNPPISARLLGAHKTVVGFGLGVVAASIAAGTMRLAGWQGLPPADVPWLAWGASMGAAALAGDSAKSFVKRRMGIAPGARWFPADQLDFVVAGLLMLRCWVSFRWDTAAIVLVLSVLGDLAVNRIAFRLRLRDTAW